MYNPDLMVESNHEVERKLERKAELDRLMREGREQHPGLPERMLLAVADALISAGERMREGHEAHEGHEGHPAPASR